MQSRQEKAHNSNTIQKKSAETTTKASSAATASATRVPTWANAWDNNLPAGLSLDDSTLTRQDASANVPLAPSLMAPMAPFIQRAPLDSAPSPTTTPAMPAVNTQNTPTTATDQTKVDTADDSTIASPLIIEDNATDFKPGQMKRTEFLAALREDVCKTADEALAGTIWSSVGCPWVTYWFGYYGNRNSQQVEKAIRRYTPEAANVTDAKDYIPLISTRVRRAIATWATTGEVTGVPEGVPTGVPGASPAPVAGTAAGTSSTVPAKPGASAKAEGVQLKSSGDSRENTADPEAIRGQLGEGHSLDGSTQSRMGSAFGTDFSSVRVHTEASDAALSKNLNAKAFTVGDDIAFGSGEYRPGTPVGDALLAHELAHVVQQHGATTSSTMSKSKDDAGYTALEADADRSAFGAIAAIWGDAKAALVGIGQDAMPQLQSGLSLRRCDSSAPALKKVELDSEAAAKQGYRITARPRVEKAVTGMTLNVGIAYPTPLNPQEVYPIVTRWGVIEPDDNFRSVLPENNAAAITLNKVGHHQIAASVLIGPSVSALLMYEQEVVEATTLSQQELAKIPVSNYTQFRIILEKQRLELAQLGIQDQNFGGPYISNSGPNPTVPNNPPSYAYHTYTIHPHPSAKSFHWYVTLANWDGMPTQNYHGFQRKQINHQDAYDLNNTGLSAQWIIGDRNIYTIVCEQFDDKGKSLGPVYYRQVVQSLAQFQALEKRQHYMELATQNIAKIQKGREAAVRAVYVDKRTAATMSLALFIGPDAADPKAFKLVDLTPSLDRREYGGPTMEAALDDFANRNKYPEGLIQLEIPGTAPIRRTMQTPGDTTAAVTAKVLGWASIGLTAFGVIATATGIGEVVAPLFFLGARVAAGASAVASLYDRIHDSEPSGIGITIDILGIVGSILSATSAFRVLSQGKQVALASRTGQFLLWANYTTDTVAGILLSVESVEQINHILNTDMPDSQQIDAIVRIIAHMAIVSSMVVLGTRDLARNRKYIASILGESAARNLSVQSLQTLSLLEAQAIKALEGAKDSDLAKLTILVGQNPEAINQLARKYGKSLLTAIQSSTYGSVEELETALASASSGSGGKPPAPPGAPPGGIPPAPPPNTPANPVGRPGQQGAPVNRPFTTSDQPGGAIPALVPPDADALATGSNVRHLDGRQRPILVEGWLYDTPTVRSSAAQRGTSGPFRDVGDPMDATHLISGTLGGPGDRANLVPLSQSINRVDIRNLEKQLEGIVRNPNSNPLYMQVYVSYGGVGDLPSELVYRVFQLRNGQLEQMMISTFGGVTVH